MKIIFLQRHAKSSWGDPSLPDFERPLNERGMEDAPRMGKRLALSSQQPELIISSPAFRAIATAKIIARELNYPEKNIQLEKEIYLIEPDDLLEFIKSIDDKYKRVMIVGHNPGLTILCNQLTDSNIENIPTSGIAKIMFNVNTWQAVLDNSGQLLEFDYPKSIDD
jgi:phosphohistidine phosphatase